MTDHHQVVDLSRPIYSVIPRGCRDTFHVDIRYQDLVYRGGGAYGCVVSANDSNSGRKVAIKKISDVLRDTADGKRMLRELKLLRHLGGHENISWILDVMVYPPLRSGFRDLYICMDLMDTDLAHLLESPQKLSDAHIKYFTYQMLRGLKYLHSSHILHRDLKPQNVLVNANCELAIADLGLARFVGTPPQSGARAETLGTAAKQQGSGSGGATTLSASSSTAASAPSSSSSSSSAPANPFAAAFTSAKPPSELTMYVVTRWYRAPELLLQQASYDGAVDLWSIGCILAEMLCRKPLFPGRHALHQLQVILDVTGTPSDGELEWLAGHESAVRIIKSFPKRRPANLGKLFPTASAQLLDLLSKLLQFDPARRITAVEALAHPFLADYACAADEPSASLPDPAAFAFDAEERPPRGELEKLFLAEMAFFRPGIGLDGRRPKSTRLWSLTRSMKTVASTATATTTTTTTAGGAGANGAGGSNTAAVSSLLKSSSSTSSADATKSSNPSAAAATSASVPIAATTTGGTERSNSSVSAFASASGAASTAVGATVSIAGASTSERSSAAASANERTSSTGALVMNRATTGASGSGATAVLPSSAAAQLKALQAVVAATGVVGVSASGVTSTAPAAAAKIADTTSAAAAAAAAPCKPGGAAFASFLAYQSVGISAGQKTASSATTSTSAAGPASVLTAVATTTSSAVAASSFEEQRNTAAWMPAKPPLSQPFTVPAVVPLSTAGSILPEPSAPLAKPPATDTRSASAAAPTGESTNTMAALQAILREVREIKADIMATMEQRLARLEASAILPAESRLSILEASLRAISAATTTSHA